MKQKTGIEVGNNDTEFRQSYWSYDYNLIFGENNWSYWTSCRCTTLRGNYVLFCLQTVGHQSIAMRSLYATNNKFTGGPGFTRSGSAVRPIVSINLKTSKYSLKKIKDADENVSFLLEKDN